MLAAELTPEFALLAACLRPPDDVAAPAAVRAAASAPLDWPLVLRLARRHRVAAGLAAGLKRAGIAVPSPETDMLGSLQANAVLEELSLAATARRLLAAFARADLPVGVLKGLPLSYTIHDRLGLRTSRDIDLLVAPAHARAALALLAESGFAPRYPLGAKDERTLDRLMRRHKDVETIHPATGQVVELHWRLFDNAHLLPLGTTLPLTPARLDADTACAVLPQRLNLLYLCNHGAQHAWSRLKWIADAGALLFRLGPAGREQLYVGTSVAEGRRAVGQTLLLCERLFAMPSPPAVTDDLQRDRRLRTLLGIAMRSLTEGAGMELEGRRFGSTLKNLSHYLILGSPRYLAAEAWFDLNDLSALPSDSRWRSLGPVGRIGSWLARLAGVQHVAAR